MKKKIVWVVLAVSILVSAGLAAAQEKDEVLFMAPVFNIQGTGMSVDAVEQIGKKVLEVVEERTGLKIGYEKVGNTSLQQREAMDLTVERLKKGGDLSWLDFPTYRKALAAGVPIKPLAIVEIGGDLTLNNCIYVKKGGGARKLEDLRGKKINGGPMLDWVSLRQIMDSQGVDERPDEFFGDLAPVNTVFSAFNFLLMGKIDAFTIHETLFRIIRKGNPNYEKVAPLVCAEGSTNTLLPVYREGMDPRARDMFKEILITAHQDPAFGMVKPFMDAAGIRFVKVTDKTLGALNKSYDTALKKGWFKEADDYYVNFGRKAKERKLKNCVKECSGSTAEKVKSCYRDCEDKFGGAGGG